MHAVPPAQPLAPTPLRSVVRPRGAESGRGAQEPTLEPTIAALGTRVAMPLGDVPAALGTRVAMPLGDVPAARLPRKRLPMTPAAAGTQTKSGAGPSDAALVVAARAGEAWAREALFRRHARMALGLAYRLLPRDVEVDDVVQDCFVYALQRLDSLQNPQAFAAWLGSIVVRTVGKRLRRRRLLTRLGLRARETIDPDQVTAASAPGDVRVALRRVYAIVEELPAEQRIALVLRRVDGLEIPQIAEYMGLSLSTVKRRLKAAEEFLDRTRER